MKKIATYTELEDFDPEKVGQVSLAAKSLCMWVIAIEKYGKVWRVVGPKKARLDETLESLKKKQTELAELQLKLKELQEFLNKLKKEHEEKTKEMVYYTSLRSWTMSHLLKKIKNLYIYIMLCHAYYFENLCSDFRNHAFFRTQNNVQI